MTQAKPQTNKILNTVQEIKSQYVDSELQDKITLWMIRVIINLGGHKEFMDKNNYFRNDEVACFLLLDEYINKDTDTFKRSEVIEKMAQDLKQLESKTNFSTSKTLEQNIENLSKLLKLNVYEKKILEFCILIKQIDVLKETCDFLGNDLNNLQVKRYIAKILDIPFEEVKNAFAPNGIFEKSSLLKLDKRNTHRIACKIEFISDEFLDNMYGSDTSIEQMLKQSIRLCSKSALTLKDYSHIKNDIDILYAYLKNAIKAKQSGVNILLYGVPGTGKTELTKVLAQKIRTTLYEISYADEEDDSIDGKKRLDAYKTAQALLANKKTFLMYDEAEDVFESSNSFFNQKRQKDKAWLNRMLESNPIPTIWITNNINSIDTAIVRRFDMSIEVPIPKKSQREKIIAKYTKDIVPKHTIQELAKSENIAPALLETAAKVVKNIEPENKEKVFKHLLNNTLKAQGYKEIKEKKFLDLPHNYNPSFVNSDVDLQELTQGIKQTGNARICLYGPAGTGKSAFGKYVAEVLNKKVILKKVSDLQSKWLGECEKNIAKAFEEAQEENAVLIFDEVDSFLQNRENAHASWEISQVNEMLVQMENFDGIFIATTNLMDNLDKASLRRFDLKMKFNYLQSSQNWGIFCSYAKELKLRTNSAIKKQVENLQYLTPGDFAAVVRQNRFRPIKNINDFIARLENEIAVKQIQNSSKMGFV